MTISVIPISRLYRESLGPWQTHDKVSLRLVAEQHQIAVSRACIVSVEGREKGGLVDFSACLAPSRQVSLVLIDPFVLDGKVLRLFAEPRDFSERLNEFVDRVSARLDRFAFIIMEILDAKMTGIAAVSDGKLIAEVGFGHFIGKGVVDTTTYVFDPELGVVAQRIVTQQTGFVIERGRSREIPVGAAPELTMATLADLYRASTALVQSEEFANCTIEYGVLDDGSPYVIDIIRDEGLFTAEFRKSILVVSPGVIVGQALKMDSPTLATSSLDSHFHSSMNIEQLGRNVAKRVIVARRPFLALEQIVNASPSQNLGFVFEGGSRLCHLAIILRERGIPAVILAKALDIIDDGDLVMIDTSDPSKGVVRRLSPQGSRSNSSLVDTV